MATQPDEAVEYGKPELERTSEAVERPVRRDPVTVFMDGIFERVPERYMGDEPGFDDLTEDEKVVFTTLMFDAQVFGCGFAFYFEHTNHNHHPHVLAGLRRLGARECVTVFERAKRRFVRARDQPVADRSACAFTRFGRRVHAPWRNGSGTTSSSTAGRSG